MLEDTIGIKPIETNYKGYRFRSRLEARWAVVFDTLEWNWEYENQGLNIEGLHYLPDFYFRDLFGMEVYIEVKPPLSEVSDNELLKTAKLNDAIYPKGICLIIFGNPDPIQSLSPFSFHTDSTGAMEYRSWCITMINSGFALVQIGGESKIISIRLRIEKGWMKIDDCQNLRLSEGKDKTITAALVAGRSTRFEFGENE